MASVLPYTFASISQRGYSPYETEKRQKHSIVAVKEGETGGLFIGVFNGHGDSGGKISHFFKSTLPSCVFSDINYPNDPLLATKRQLDLLEKCILSDPSIDTEYSGTTAVICIIIRSRLYSIGIGNSRAVLAHCQHEDNDVLATQLTIDHVPCCQKEKARIISKGGRVFKVKYGNENIGRDRVWLSHMDVPGLALSRSLGNSIVKAIGINSIPDCSVLTLHHSFKYLIIASNGFWEVMSNEEVAKIALAIDDCKKCVNVFFEEASQRWMSLESVVGDFVCCLLKLYDTGEDV